ncbi:hypothetical protein L1987_57802 [Smallanthus sonchifolius]|uniref:Uncharacterized protein n=1 Tax=Smallanthus sonchifolius TaxID=185202 RepID=A0ACB9DE19_9ASTR|nr:hypothetical protein L1987_57802 [Smallanthus sonchifolius]
MGKKMTRSTSSIIAETIEDFTDQGILDHSDPELCSFTDQDIKLLKSNNVFPQKTVFRSFDFRTKADLISKTWVCFHSYPFTLGLSYPFPPLITEFFKLTCLSYYQTMPMEEVRISAIFNISNLFLIILFFLYATPKFAELVPARSDTEKRIEALLEIPVAERSFRVELTISEASFEIKHSESEMSSGIPKSSFQFALSDLNSLLSGAVVIKKEGSTLATTKSRIPVLRSKGSRSKKRKTTDVMDLEFSEGMDSAETTKKLQGLMNLGLEKLNVNLAAAEKNAEAALEKEDLAQSDQKLQKTVDNAKRSAAMAILQSKIQIAEQAATEGFDPSAWDLQGWHSSLAKLGGETVDTSKVVEDARASDGEKQANQGNEGNDA